LVAVIGGVLYTKGVRRNTWAVALGTLPLFALAGFAGGNALGGVVFPSVANNKETTMMRRTWWAKECAKNWDMSQIDADRWKADYPHITIPK
jgi:hypothetical protein